jgi:hypothetical protein
MRYRHIALLVGEDLRGAEEYYSHLFDMEVVLREGPLEPGGPDADAWGQLPEGKSWDDAVAAGVEIGFVALQRGDVILPLFAAEPTGERFYAIGFVTEPEEIAAVEDRLGNDEVVEGTGDGWLAFVDRYGTRWQLSEGFEFRGAGEIRGDWLDV